MLPHHGRRLDIAVRLRDRSERRGDCLVYTAGRNERGGHAVVGYQGKKQRVHRVAWMLVNGPIPEGQIVRHTCDVPRCINIDHLLLGTHQDNVRDRVSRDRTARGSRQGLAKLTEDTVRLVRQRLAGGEMQKVIAQELGVSEATIWAINKGETWTHVTP